MGFTQWLLASEFSLKSQLLPFCPGKNREAGQGLGQGKRLEFELGQSILALGSSWVFSRETRLSQRP